MVNMKWRTPYSVMTSTMSTSTEAMMAARGYSLNEGIRPPVRMGCARAGPAPSSHAAATAATARTAWGRSTRRH